MDRSGPGFGDEHLGSNFQCSKPEKQISSIDHLAFSPNDKILYFLASAWTTSNALHRVNIDGKNQRYIAPAQSLELIAKGEYKGYLIVSQHRYFIPPGGSYDWYWLLILTEKRNVNVYLF